TEIAVIYAMILVDMLQFLECPPRNKQDDLKNWMAIFGWRLVNPQEIIKPPKVLVREADEGTQLGVNYRPKNANSSYLAPLEDIHWMFSFARNVPVRCFRLAIVIVKLTGNPHYVKEYGNGANENTHCNR
ncbi:11838_t:CDS:2, partial [Ambispora gerdemannii]